MSAPNSDFACWFKASSTLARNELTATRAAMPIVIANVASNSRRRLPRLSRHAIRINQDQDGAACARFLVRLSIDMKRMGVKSVLHMIFDNGATFQPNDSLCALSQFQIVCHQQGGGS